MKGKYLIFFQILKMLNGENKMEKEFVILFVRSNIILLDENSFEFSSRIEYEKYIEFRKPMMKIDKEIIFKKSKINKYVVINVNRFKSNLILCGSHWITYARYFNNIIFYSFNSEYIMDNLSIIETLKFSQTELKFLNKFLNNENKYFLLKTENHVKNYLLNIIKKFFYCFNINKACYDYGFENYIFVNMNDLEKIKCNEEK